tara:strand:- start:64 stop:321 length:258 start_codon:yes stop_codon:yes gene_type:complete
MKYTVDEKEKTIKIHTNVSTESLKSLLENYKGYTVIFEDASPQIQMITDSGYDPINITEPNPYDIQYTGDNTCCGGNCGCNNNEK